MNKTSSPARRSASLILIGFGLLLPALSLIPLGSLWLWQNGYLIHWAAFAFVAVTAVYLAQRRFLPASSQSVPSSSATTTPNDANGLAREFAWSPAEEEAWKDVKALADSADPEKIATSDGLLALGQSAIEAVARRLHPGRTDPLWQFTTPEALAIIERVSRRLRLMVLERVPFGDRLTVAQALALYRKRGLYETAERAYDVWRVIRLVNPATAAAQEAREQLSRAMVQWGRDAIARRLTQAYVTEIGRAAIDLYGGRLRVSSADLAGFVSDETVADRVTLSQVRAEPLRILVAGQTSAGKSSLVNALAKEAQAATDALPATSDFKSYVIEREGFPAAVIVDSPGVGGDGEIMAELIERSTDFDLILWVVGAHRADRELDRSTLERLRVHFAGQRNRRRPPMLLVATHIDRLRPFGQWSPIEDIVTDTSEKARNIRASLAAIASDLDFAADEIIPVSLADPEQPYNVERLWARIADALPEAMRAQLLRCLHALKDDWKWKSVLSQAGNASRALAGSLWGRSASGRRGG